MEQYEQMEGLMEQENAPYDDGLYTEEGMPVEYTGNDDLDDMATEGRKGDNQMAHVGEGEIHIPKEIWMEHPEFLPKLKKIFEDRGYDYRQFISGSGFESRNPDTGAAEFGLGDMFGGISGINVKDPGSIVGGITGGRFGGHLGKTLMGGHPLGRVGGALMGSRFGSMLGGKLGLGGGNDKAKQMAIMMAMKRRRERLAPMREQQAKLGEMGLDPEQQRAYLATQSLYGGGATEREERGLQEMLRPRVGRGRGRGGLMDIEEEYVGQYGSTPRAFRTAIRRGS